MKSLLGGTVPITIKVAFEVAFLHAASLYSLELCDHFWPTLVFGQSEGSNSSVSARQSAKEEKRWGTEKYQKRRKGTSQMPAREKLRQRRSDEGLLMRGSREGKMKHERGGK